MHRTFLVAVCLPFLLFLHISCTSARTSLGHADRETPGPPWFPLRVSESQERGDAFIRVDGGGRDLRAVFIHLQGSREQASIRSVVVKYTDGRTWKIYGAPSPIYLPRGSVSEITFVYIGDRFWVNNHLTALISVFGRSR